MPPGCARWGIRRCSGILTAQHGQTHRVLMEGPRLGRTEQFTEVAFTADQPEGTILDVAILGHDGARLLA